MYPNNIIQAGFGILPGDNLHSPQESPKLPITNISQMKYTLQKFRYYPSTSEHNSQISIVRCDEILITEWGNEQCLCYENKWLCARMGI